MYVNTKNLVWFTSPDKIYDEKIKQLLFDNTSLTAKLKKNYSNFKIELLNEKKDNIYQNEMGIWATDKEQVFYVREVLLYGNNKPQVFARSIIPSNTRVSSLLGLGNKSLGEVLFNNKDIRRHSTEFSKTPNNIWGRRSVFILSGVKILVCEFFINNAIFKD